MSENCPACRFSIPRGARRCGHCGEDLREWRRQNEEATAGLIKAGGVLAIAAVVIVAVLMLFMAIVTGGGFAFYGLFKPELLSFIHEEHAKPDGGLPFLVWLGTVTGYGLALIAAGGAGYATWSNTSNKGFTAVAAIGAAFGYLTLTAFAFNWIYADEIASFRGLNPTVAETAPVQPVAKGEATVSSTPQAPRPEPVAEPQATPQTAPTTASLPTPGPLNSVTQAKEPVEADLKEARRESLVEAREPASSVPAPMDPRIEKLLNLSGERMFTEIPAQISRFEKVPHTDDRAAARRLNDAGIVMMKEKNYLEASKIFRQAWNADSGDVEITGNLANAYLEAGQFLEAIDFAQRSITMTNNLAIYSWYNLGAALGGLGDLSRSTKAFSIYLHFSKDREKSVAVLRRKAAEASNTTITSAIEAAIASSGPPAETDQKRREEPRPPLGGSSESVGSDSSDYQRAVFAALSGPLAKANPWEGGTITALRDGTAENGEYCRELEFRENAGSRQIKAACYVENQKQWRFLQ